MSGFLYFVTSKHYILNPLKSIEYNPLLVSKVAVESVTVWLCGPMASGTAGGGVSLLKDGLIRTLVLGLILAGSGLPMYSAKPLTVAEMKARLEELRGKRDSRVAGQIRNMLLTERLSRTRLAQLEEEFPGKETYQELTILADRSDFLKTPDGDLNSDAAPSLDERRKLLALTVEYVKKAASRLPNLVAMKRTISYEEAPVSAYMAYESLHPVGKSEQMIVVRDGRETADLKGTTARPVSPRPGALRTSGEFSSTMLTVIVDASHGEVRWEHWEAGPSSPRAVFAYKVPKEESHYDVASCCVVDRGAERFFHEHPAYHGEIVIDPADGTIVRVTLIADLLPKDSLVEANVSVDYGPVEIGGVVYTCPVHSVSLSTAHLRTVSAPSKALSTSMNDVVFERYHLFRSESKMIVGDQ
jgi:hypothetical protein